MSNTLSKVVSFSYAQVMAGRALSAFLSLFINSKASYAQERYEYNPLTC
jgi:hypothetical protein